MADPKRSESANGDRRVCEGGRASGQRGAAPPPCNARARAGADGGEEGGRRSSRRRFRR